MKPRLSILHVVVFAVPVLCCAQPSQNDIIKSHIPEDSKVVEKVKGDFNRDGSADYALVIERKSEASPTISLLIIESGEGGKYRVAVESGAAIAKADLGAPMLEVKKVVLSVAWPWNGIGRNQTDYSLQVRKDPGTGRYLLIGEDWEEFDSIERKGKSDSINHLTGSRISTSYHWEQKKVVDQNKKTRFSPTKVFLEDIDYEGYETAFPY